VTAVTVWVRGVTAQLHVADKQSVMPSTRCSRVSVHPVQQAAEQCAILSLFCQYIDDGAKTFSLCNTLQFGYGPRNMLKDSTKLLFAR